MLRPACWAYSTSRSVAALMCSPLALSGAWPFGCSPGSESAARRAAGQRSMAFEDAAPHACEREVEVAPRADTEVCGIVGGEVVGDGAAQHVHCPAVRFGPIFVEVAGPAEGRLRKHVHAHTHPTRWGRVCPGGIRTSE